MYESTYVGPCILHQKVHTYVRTYNTCIYIISYIHIYNIEGKFGDGFNLMIWQFRAKPPNQKPPIF